MKTGIYTGVQFSPAMMSEKRENFERPQLKTEY
jgi:hypothetical protein